MKLEERTFGTPCISRLAKYGHIMVLAIKDRQA